MQQSYCDISLATTDKVLHTLSYYNNNTSTFIYYHCSIIYIIHISKSWGSILSYYDDEITLVQIIIIEFLICIIEKTFI